MQIEFDILTLFPEMVEGYLSSSMLRRGSRTATFELMPTNYATGQRAKHSKTDEIPFGGGAGMVMKPELIFAAVESLQKEESMVIYMAPDGEPLNSRLPANFPSRNISSF